MVDRGSLGAHASDVCASCGHGKNLHMRERGACCVPGCLCGAFLPPAAGVVPVPDGPPQGYCTNDECSVERVEPCPYVVGQTYAVQPGRGKRAVGRIRVLAVDRRPTFPISREDAIAEGFESPTGFETQWLGFYGDKHPECWRIEFELVESTA